MSRLPPHVKLAPYERDPKNSHLNTSSKRIFDDAKRMALESIDDFGRIRSIAPRPMLAWIDMQIAELIDLYFQICEDEIR